MTVTVYLTAGVSRTTADAVAALTTTVDAVVPEAVPWACTALETDDAFVAAALVADDTAELTFAPALIPLRAYLPPR